MLSIKWQLVKVDLFTPMHEWCTYQLIQAYLYTIKIGNASSYNSWYYLKIMWFPIVNKLEMIHLLDLFLIDLLLKHQDSVTERKPGIKTVSYTVTKEYSTATGVLAVLASPQWYLFLFLRLMGQSSIARSLQNWITST